MTSILQINLRFRPNAPALVPFLSYYVSAGSRHAVFIGTDSGHWEVATILARPAKDASEQW